MNLFLFTAQIITQPEVIKIKSNSYIVILVSIPNNKKKLAFFKLRIYFKNYFKSDLLDICQYKKFVIIEGNINIKKYLLNSDSFIQQSQKQKYIEVQVNKIQPCIV